MKHLHSSCFILLVLLFLSGCAGMAPRTGPVRAPEAGVQKDIALQLETIQDDLALLNAKLQDQEKKLEELRAAVVAQKVTSRGESAANMPASPEVTGGNAAAETPGSSPTEVYLKAFSDYASGRYSDAIAGFQSFLQLFPGNDYSGNAQYWLGECYYAQKRYNEAAEAFRKVAEFYPKGSKTPEALHKLATSLQQMNQPERAQEILQLLRERYPDSSAAQKNLPAE